MNWKRAAVSKVKCSLKCTSQMEKNYWPAASLAHSSSSETGISSRQQQTAHPAHLWVAAAFAVLEHCPCYALGCAVRGMLLESQLPPCSWRTVWQPTMYFQIQTRIQVNSLWIKTICCTNIAKFKLEATNEDIQECWIVNQYLDFSSKLNILLSPIILNNRPFKSW